MSVDRNHGKIRMAKLTAYAFRIISAKLTLTVCSGVLDPPDPMYSVILTIPLAQYDLFVEKIHPLSRAYELLMNGCFDQEICDGHLERKMQILCNKDEAVMLLQVAEEVCPRIIPKISRDWLAK